MPPFDTDDAGDSTASIPVAALSYQTPTDGWGHWQTVANVVAIVGLITSASSIASVALSRWPSFDGLFAFPSGLSWTISLALNVFRFVASFMLLRPTTYCGTAMLWHGYVAVAVAIALVFMSFASILMRSGGLPASQLPSYTVSILNFLIGSIAYPVTCIAIFHSAEARAQLRKR